MKNSKFKMIGVLFLWVWGVTFGLNSLFHFSNTAGVEANLTVNTWPQHTSLVRRPQKNSLVLFLHPRCGCSKATLAELEKLMPELREHTDVTFLFYRPEGRSDQWIQQDLWRQAKEIEGALVKIDEDHREMNLFHASTSGQTYFFSPSGELLFSGGITAARGHRGDNEGSRALSALAKSPIGRLIKTPVFGCSFFQSDSKRIPAREAL